MFLSKISRYLYGGSTEKSDEERILLFKIDCTLIPFICLNYWINYVDRTGVSNAYVSGMKEDLGFTGNQYNIMNTCFTVGYILFMIPNNVALLKFPPRYWLPFCCMSWGLLTLAMYRVTSVEQLYIIRFFQAAFESSTFNGSHLIMGSWYKDTEISKRAAIFTSSGLIGSCFSGLMQAKIYTNLSDHKFGSQTLPGWRWLFIIDFFITIPIAIYGFVCFPNVPEKNNSFLFTNEEIQLAITRLPHRKKTKLDISVFRRVFGNWHWYLFSLLWALGGENESFATNSLLALYLQYFNFSVSHRNYYPMGVYAVGIVATISLAWYVDFKKAQTHHHCAAIISVALLISSILLLVHPMSDSFVFAAHYISGIAYAGQAIFFSWANKVMQGDLEERAITIASMNMFSGALNAWWSILFYSAADAPTWHKGCYAMIATTISSSLVASLIRFLEAREEKSSQLTNVKCENIGSDLTIDQDIRNLPDIDEDVKTSG